MDTKELAKWVANNRLSVNGALLAKSTQDAILSALELAAAVEGEPGATPETDAMRGAWMEDEWRFFTHGAYVRVKDAATLEHQRNAALRALKAERASNEIYRNHILSRPNEDQDSQAQEHESQPDKASDQAGIPVAALAAQEGRT